MRMKSDFKMKKSKSQCPPASFNCVFFFRSNKHRALSTNKSIFVLILILFPSKINIRIFNAFEWCNERWVEIVKVHFKVARRKNHKIKFFTLHKIFSGERVTTVVKTPCLIYNHHCMLRDFHYTWFSVWTTVLPQN